MLPWIVILAILGLVLVFAEMLIPGFGLFGILGVIALLGSAIFVAETYGTLAFLVALFLIVALFFIMIMIAKKSGLYNRVILHEKQDSQDFDESKLNGLLGKEGITLSTLRPYGVAEFDGVSVDVCSLGDFIDRGIKVKVTQISGKMVTVRESK